MNTKQSAQQLTQKRRALLAQVSEADLRLLRVFIAIAESGGLSAAELTLNISRSVISRHLKDLEDRLGVRLCERGRAGFALTGEGVVVLDAARRLLGQLDAFRNQIAELHDELRGDLHVAVFDKFATNPNCRIAQAIAEFGDAAPAVRLHLHIDSGSVIEQGIIDGRFAVAVQPFHRASDSIRSLPLFREQMHRALVSLAKHGNLLASGAGTTRHRVGSGGDAGLARLRALSGLSARALRASL